MCLTPPMTLWPIIPVTRDTFSLETATERVLAMGFGPAASQSAPAIVPVSFSILLPLTCGCIYSCYVNQAWDEGVARRDAGRRACVHGRGTRRPLCLRNSLYCKQIVSYISFAMSSIHLLLLSIVSVVDIRCLSFSGDSLDNHSYVDFGLGSASGDEGTSKLSATSDYFTFF